MEVIQRVMAYEVEFKDHEINEGQAWELSQDIMRYVRSYPYVKIRIDCQLFKGDQCQTSTE